MCMDQVTDRLPVITAIHNDICAFLKTPEQHNDDLIQLIHTANKNGIIFESRKCNIIKSETSFNGIIFTKDGMKPDLTKV